MSGRRVLLLALSASVMVGAAPCFGQGGAPDVTLYMPALASEPPALGLRAATVLNLQIWQTLRQAPFPNPDHVSFGKGLVIWGEAPLSEATHDGAARRAAAQGADMALWGRAWRYGNGVAVQTYLTVVDESAAATPRWTAELTLERGPPLSLGVGLPRLRYEFAPIVLEAPVVEALASPAGLSIVAEEGSKKVIGEVGPAFRALQHDGAWTLVESGPLTGWIHLPQLSRQRSEIVDFTGGLIRLLRTDWAGAVLLLQRVAANPSAPHGVRVDAHLMIALAQSHLGGDRQAEIVKAYALNPYEIVTTKYECMDYVTRLAARPAPDLARELRQKLGRILDERRFLYSAQDAWFAKVRSLVQAAP